jgi:pimeloyl-ACP methyl ester carboxylesterase
VVRRAVGLPAGGSLALALHLPEADRPVPCVLACHGLGASKDSDKYLLLAALFPAAGLALARFDFRGCGASSGVEDDTTVATRLEDARLVLAVLGAEPRLDGRFGLLGSSMGGYAALHLAAVLADDTPVVTWNAPAHLHGIRRAMTGGTPGLRGLVEEIERGQFAEAPAGVPRHLAIQAGADEVVPPEHGHALRARAAEPSGLVVIPGADHRLTDPTARREAVRHSLEWLGRFLLRRAQTASGDTGHGRSAVAPSGQ